MSAVGTGRIQRVIAAAFDAEPNRRFTTRQLAALAFPDQPIGAVEMHTINRALHNLTGTLGLARSRIGTAAGASGRGWHHVWGKA